MPCANPSLVPMLDCCGPTGNPFTGYSFFYKIIGTGGNRACLNGYVPEISAYYAAAFQRVADSMISDFQGIDPFSDSPLINFRTGLHFKPAPGEVKGFVYEDTGDVTLGARLPRSGDDGIGVDVGDPTLGPAIAINYVQQQLGSGLQGGDSYFTIVATMFALEGAPPWCKYYTDFAFAGVFGTITGCEKGEGNAIMLPSPGFMSDLKSKLPGCPLGTTRTILENMVLRVPSLLQGTDPWPLPQCCA